MALFNFIKTEKPGGFTYKPRFYDEKKESLQERLQEARELASSDDPEAMKSRIRRDLRRKGGYRTDKTFRQKRVARSNMMIVVIIVALVIATYAALELYLPAIVKYFE